MADPIPGVFIPFDMPVPKDYAERLAAEMAHVAEHGLGHYADIIEAAFRAEADRTVPVAKAKMRSALADARVWSDPAMGSPRSEYWLGMRQVLEVMLGLTTEPPTLSDENPAALLLLSERTVDPPPLPLFWTQWDWDGKKTTYGKDCEACGASYENCTRKVLRQPGKACCGTCFYTQTHAETEKRPA